MRDKVTEFEEYAGNESIEGLLALNND